LGIKIPAPGKIATANKVALKIWMWLAHRQNAGARLGINVECVSIRCLLPQEALIYSASGMKSKEPGAQKARHIMRIGELSSTARRSNSPAQSINQCLPRRMNGISGDTDVNRT
jgi:hypothetical protein